MADKLIDRIKVVLDHYKLSNRAFDASIGKGNGYISKQLTRRASIGSDTVETILHTYKEISPAWLVTGEGEMIRSEAKPENLNEDQFENLLLTYLEKPKIQEAIKNILNGKEK